MYEGTSRTLEVIVVSLLDDLVDLNHRLYMDNYYNSVDVSFEELSLTDPPSDADEEQETVGQQQARQEEETVRQQQARQEEEALPTTTDQQQKGKRQDKVCLGELWGQFRDPVADKGKPLVQKAEENKGIETDEAISGGKDRDDDDIVGDDEEEYGVKETYSEYSPVYLTYGLPHPDTVVESSSLASVLPPAITRDLHLPQDLIDERRLSNVQLEAVAYASQMHDIIMPNRSRAGYLIGDGAGVGKGRTIAGKY